ncbi:MAG: hypothetical protein RMJ16_10315 [Thermoguttaceae bacterium]|nr:hypothetical protein [Thermoguttaceae bacterium]
MFWCWRQQGVWEQIHAALRQMLRLGGSQSPSAHAGDRGQLIGQNHRWGGGERGFDAAKKVKVLEHHLVLNTLGLVWAVVVHAASVQDQVGAWEVFARLLRSCPGVETVFGEAAYRRERLVEPVRQAF